MFARHYQRSGAIRFHAKDGTVFTSNIEARWSFPDPQAFHDVTVARINPCLPKGWTIYPLLDPNDNYVHPELVFAPYINTHYNITDNIRRLSVTRVGYAVGLVIYGAMSTVVPNFMQVSAVTGDSGNPSFLLVEGKQVLVSTFTYGGYGGGGPFYGGATIQSLVLEGIAALP